MMPLFLDLSVFWFFFEIITLFALLRLKVILKIYNQMTTTLCLVILSSCFTCQLQLRWAGKEHLSWHQTLIVNLHASTTNSSTLLNLSMTQTYSRSLWIWCFDRVQSPKYSFTFGNLLFSSLNLNRNNLLLWQILRIYII